MRTLRTAVTMLGFMTVLTGIVYPLAVTGLAQLGFPHRANGSLIRAGDRVVGSELIGQGFSDPKYFWGRLSATASVPYDAALSSGSNYGPLNDALALAAKTRVDALRAADPGNATPIPVDLVSASGSGLDPHVSPAAARWQVARVARARGLEPAAVRRLVDAHTQGRQLGILGEPVVAVLPLNRALDALTARVPQ